MILFILLQEFPTYYTNQRGGLGVTEFVLMSGMAVLRGCGQAGVKTGKTQPGSEGGKKLVIKAMAEHPGA